MFDFKKELEILLEEETRPLPSSAHIELIASEARVIAELDKRHTDVSMQIEEIYDIVNSLNTAELEARFKDERKRSRQLIEAAVAMCDMLEDFSAFARQHDDAALMHQAALMLKNADALLNAQGLARFGEEGAPLNPKLHSVKATVPSTLPRETVSQVLSSGYRYMGNVLRKAAVVLSEG